MEEKKMGWGIGSRKEKKGGEGKMMKEKEEMAEG